MRHDECLCIQNTNQSFEQLEEFATINLKKLENSSDQEVRITYLLIGQHMGTQ